MTVRGFVLAVHPRVLPIITVNLTEVPVVATPDGPGRVRAFITAGARPPVLSRRQWDLLRLLDQGLTNGQIGSKLGVDGTTVKSHATRLYRALGVHGRVEAVLVAYRRGWLS